MHPANPAMLTHCRHSDLIREAEQRRLVTQTERARRFHHLHAPVLSRSFDRCPDPEVHHMTAQTCPTTLSRRVASAVGAALLFGTAACGSHSSNTSPTDAAFLKRANQACAPAAAALNKHQFPYNSFDPEHPKAADLRKVGQFLAGLYPELSDTVDKLRALTPPPGLAAEWKSFGDLVVEERANTAAQNKDAENSDVPAFVKTVKKAESLSAQIKTVGHEIGFVDSSTCSDVLI
jgi:hypothetical protein